jgi:hypothetical protein
MIDMTRDEALLLADSRHDNGLRTETDVALAVLAAEVRRLNVALNLQAQLAERLIEAMNRNADLGQAAEAAAKRYRYLRNRNVDEAIQRRGPSAGVWIDCESESGALVMLTGDDADAAIDEAMKL